MSSVTKSWRETLRVGSSQIEDLLPAQRRKKDAQLRNCASQLVGQKRTSDEGISLEENIALLQEGTEVIEIHRLQIAPDIQDQKPRIGAKGLNLASCPEMILPPIHLARPGGTAGIENQAPELRAEFRIQTVERPVKGTLSHAGGAAQNDKPSGHVRL